MLLVLPLPGCEELNQSRTNSHDELRNHQELEEVEAVEEAVRLRGQDQAVEKVEPDGGEGQVEFGGAPGKAPSCGPPVLGHPQAQQGPTVPGQRGEGH